MTLRSTWTLSRSITRVSPFLEESVCQIAADKLNYISELRLFLSYPSMRIKSKRRTKRSLGGSMALVNVVIFNFSAWVSVWVLMIGRMEEGGLVTRTHAHRRQSWGWGLRPQILRWERGVAGVVGSRKYDYTLFCTVLYRKWWNIEILENFTQKQNIGCKRKCLWA